MPSSDNRRLPPSPRRRALARRAGLHAASPVAVAAIAWIAVVLGLARLGPAIGAQLGGWLRAACAGQTGLAPGGLVTGVVSLVLPLGALVAVAALVAHLAQTGAPWLPRRKTPGAPVAAPHRARRAAFELIGAGVLAGVGLGWWWLVAPRLAALVGVDPLLPAAGTLLLALVATLAATWIAIGALDLAVRRADLARDLAMSHADKRQDDRLAAADPRWRARRNQLARAHGPAELDAAVAGALLLLLGDDVAVAIAWDPTRRPIPTRTATGRATRATQLLGLARRHHLPVHRDPALARALADRVGPVDEIHWPRLAELVATRTSTSATSDG